MMPSHWVVTTVGDLLAGYGGSIKTGPFGTTLKAAEYSSDGIPLISVREIGYGVLRVDASTPRVPSEVVERLPEYILEPGDIVFGRKGAVDRSAIVREEQGGWFLGSDGIRLRLPDVCDPRFIAYQLQSPRVRSWLLQNATGTTMASLNQEAIERIPIVLPTLPEQRAIAHILGTLDDKIEVNRRMSETLEAMARALFKSWFVDFDPVRAKAATLACLRTLLTCSRTPSRIRSWVRFRGGGASGLSPIWLISWVVARLVLGSRPTGKAASITGLPPRTYRGYRSRCWLTRSDVSPMQASNGSVLDCFHGVPCSSPPERPSATLPLQRCRSRSIRVLLR